MDWEDDGTIEPEVKSKRCVTWGAPRARHYPGHYHPSVVVLMINDVYIKLASM